jgi:hypothetical protein
MRGCRCRISDLDDRTGVDRHSSIPFVAWLCTTRLLHDLPTLDAMTCGDSQASVVELRFCVDTAASSQ